MDKKGYCVLWSRVYRTRDPWGESGTKAVATVPPVTGKAITWQGGSTHWSPASRVTCTRVRSNILDQLLTLLAKLGMSVTKWRENCLSPGMFLGLELLKCVTAGCLVKTSSRNRCRQEWNVKDLCKWGNEFLLDVWQKPVEGAGPPRRAYR